MYESRNEYDRILKGKVKILETFYGYAIRHGAADLCLRCGAEGEYDLYRLGFSLNGDNAIYYSTVYMEWRCQLCDYRRIP